MTLTPNNNALPDAPHLPIMPVIQRPSRIAAGLIIISSVLSALAAMQLPVAWAFLWAWIPAWTLRAWRRLHQHARHPNCFIDATDQFWLTAANTPLHPAQLTPATRVWPFLICLVFAHQTITIWWDSTDAALRRRIARRLIWQ